MIKIIKDLELENHRCLFDRNIIKSILDNSLKNNILPKGSKTKSITIQITEKCNLCCSYCFQTNKSTKSISLHNAKKFIDLILNEDCTHDTVIIDFIGGEPFLEVDLMDNICEYFISQMILKNHPWKDMYKFKLSTNGTLYFTDAVQKFIKKYNNRLSISFSVDGNKKLHDSCRVYPDGSGSYDIAVKALLYHRKKYDISVNTTMVLSPNNISYTYDAVINLINLGFTLIKISYTLEEGWNIDHAKIYYNQLKKLADYIIDNDLYNHIFIHQFDETRYIMSSNNKNWCTCGQNNNSLAVGVDGKLYPCIRFTKSSINNHEPISIGDVNGFYDKCTITNEFKQITRRSVSNDKCFYCPISLGCNWCIAYGYSLTGDINTRTTYNCDINKVESLVNTYFINKYASKKLEETKDTFYLHCRKKINCPYDWVKGIISDDEYDMLFKLARMDKGVLN